MNTDMNTESVIEKGIMIGPDRRIPVRHSDWVFAPYQYSSKFSFNIDSIRRELQDSFGNPDPNPELLKQVLSEAHHLAHESYELNNPQAKAFSERLLFTIHANNSFAPPMEGTAAIVWKVLMHKKLETAMRPFLRNGVRDFQTMESFLRREVENADTLDHPWLDKIMSVPDRRGLIIYTKNWFISAYGFFHQLFSLVQRCKGEVQGIVLENIHDEFKTSHGDLRERFFEGICKMPFDPKVALQDPVHLTESFSLLNFRTGIVAMQNPSSALGSFYSIEAAYPSVCQRLLNGFRKQKLENKDIMNYLEIHAEADVAHAEEWLVLLKKASLSPTEIESVVAGALAQLHLRREMYKSMASSFEKEIHQVV